jgi:Tfp pilus assembly PilM family ATPase
MATNFLSKLVGPRYASTAAGLEKGFVSVVQLERSRGHFGLRRAATVEIDAELVRPGFDEPNIASPEELSGALSTAGESAGLLQQRKWSVALPEASTRTLVLTLENKVSSRRELQEVLEWKMTRGFGAPLGELRVARYALSADARGQARHIASAVRLSVLAEYESVFAALGWRAGLVLPRHMGEARWLVNNGHRGTALLLTAHTEGFTAVLWQNNRPLLMRSVVCEPEDCDDELYRVLLFFRSRVVPEVQTTASPPVERLLVVGDQLDRDRAAGIVTETLGVKLQPLVAEQVGLMLPQSELRFDRIAAPAGLATLAW